MKNLDQMNFKDIHSAVKNKSIILYNTILYKNCSYKINSSLLSRSLKCGVDVLFYNSNYAMISKIHDIQIVFKNDICSFNSIRDIFKLLNINSISDVHSGKHEIILKMENGNEFVSKESGSFYDDLGEHVYFAAVNKLDCVIEETKTETRIEPIELTHHTQGDKLLIVYEAPSDLDVIYKKTLYKHSVTGIIKTKIAEIEDYCKNLLANKERYEVLKSVLKENELLTIFPDYKFYDSINSTNFNSYTVENEFSFYTDGSNYDECDFLNHVLRISEPSFYKVVGHKE